MQSKLKVSAYCRVSTDKDDQINSLTSQIKYFTDYINMHENWNMGEVFYDEGISGTSVKKREGFLRMIEHARINKVNLILTKEVSRFARNTVDTLQYTRALTEIGIGVIFILDNIDTRDKDAEFRLTLMASLAQDESRKTSERVKWGQKRRMEQGIVFGRDLLGYSVRNGKLYLNEEEAEIVKLVFHKYLVEEKGTHVIARELKESNIHPKRVREWSNTVILRMLRNEKYVGDLLQKKTFTPNYLTHAKKYNRGQEDMVYLKEHHDPIIDRATWEATQKELERRSPSAETKSKHSNRYWCSGKLICGECGQRFISRTKKLKNGSVYKAWRCYASANHGTLKQDIDGNYIGCNGKSINEKVLLYGMSYALNHIKRNKDKILKDLMGDIKTVQGDNAEISILPLHQKLERLNEKKQKAIDLVLEGLISREDLKRQTEIYEKEMESITAQIEASENHNLLKEQQIDNMQEYAAEIKKLINFDTENELLFRELLDHITVYNDNEMVIYLKSIPYGIRLHAVVSGKMEDYKIEIDQMSVEPEKST